MLELMTPIVDAMAERVSGPMSVRLYLQPLMAVFFATRSGLKDVKEGKPPYFWSLFVDADHRRDLLRDGWKSVGTVFVLAMVLDAVYQYMVQKTVVPIEAVGVALILAIIPYLIVRGLVTRTVKMARGKG